MKLYAFNEHGCSLLYFLYSLNVQQVISEGMGLFFAG